MAADVTVAPTLGHAVLMTQGGIGASPGYDAIDLRRMIQAASGAQEGVYNATGWEVREHTSGANMQVQLDANVGLARVDGESVTNQGPYIVAPHSAVITLDVTAAHSTNPRVDMVILHVRDNTHDALGANDARVRILSGTATSGATLDNLNGQQSLPSNAIRLADVLVPAADTTISNSQIRDRRKWAPGAYRRIIRTSANYTTAAGVALVDSTNLQPRIECSGVPVRMTVRGVHQHNVASATAILWFSQAGSFLEAAGATQGNVFINASSGTPTQFYLSWDLVPAAGSHLLGLMFATVTAGTYTVLATANNPLLFTIEELVRTSADNS